MKNLRKEDGYLIHKKCGYKVMLVCHPWGWTPDTEAFKNGEPTPEKYADLEPSPLNVCGHYCPKCDVMVEVWIDDEELQNEPLDTAGTGASTA